MTLSDLEQAAVVYVHWLRQVETSRFGRGPEKALAAARRRLLAAVEDAEKADTEWIVGQ